MTILVATLGKEKGTKLHLEEVIKKEEWEKIIIISENNERVKLKTEKIFYLDVNIKKRLPELSKEIKKELKSKLSGIEIALNIISGSGKLHLAVLSAILKLGYGIRFIALTEDGIKEI